MSFLKAALVGNPNGGKTTLFNGLTGARQSVGNWPGVTVERVSGFFKKDDIQIEIVDLPGTYSLTTNKEASSIDEAITCEFIAKNDVDVIINIVDASHLERHLYLTTQLLERGLPVILALNMMDVAKARAIHIDLAQLSKKLGCPVIALSAHHGDGLLALQEALTRPIPKKTLSIPYPKAIKKSLQHLQALQSNLSIVECLQLLENDAVYEKDVSNELLKNVNEQQQWIQQEADEDADILIASTRYQFIQELLEQCMRVGDSKKIDWTKRIDRFVLNRILGLPIFLSVMYLLFVVAIDVGGFFQSYFDSFSSRFFVEGVRGLLTNRVPEWFTVLMADGVGKGISTVFTFIPVIGAMFLFLAFLEDSGYMARAAFVVDRIMQALGLPGKAFVPMIVGFGCNVPAVMAARTLSHKRDRILTILMTPFMSCGARLAIYAVFTAAFFPHGGQNIVFLLYLIGVLMAIFTGFLLQRTFLRGQSAPLVMELPAYHVPHVKSVFLHAWQRLSGFVFRAGKLILPICVVLGLLNTGSDEGHTLLAGIGHFVTPIFAPMGIHADNWPATVGLVTGVLAKEVVIGTLNTLYMQMGEIHNSAALYGMMYQKFDGKIGAFAYLLFVLLYFPCVSTMAVMLREMHRVWTVFSAVWMMGAAYGIAVIFYQAATFLQHPLSSAIWIGSMLAIFFATIFSMRMIAKQSDVLPKKKHLILTRSEGRL